MGRRTLIVMDNNSVVFTLTPLNLTANNRLTIFALTCMCYCVIWMANVTIIVTIIVNKNLHEPMYIFLCNLCINGLYGTAGFYPKFLQALLSSTHVISYAGCMLQGFVLHSSSCADLSLLLLMAFDRYVAICHPLNYNSVMTKEKVGIFVFLAWFVPIHLVLIGSITTALPRLCGSHIPRIYCINLMVGKLACTASVATVIVPAFNYTIYFFHFVFILFSYGSLIKNCLKSHENRNKFMQTCLPHVICLFIFIFSAGLDLLYIRYGNTNLSQSVKNFMAIAYILIPPITHPLIYGMKLTQIRKSIVQFFLK
ncbi:olfactory receptor 52D1-like [Cynoglossus semilaevis]|uniref:olfactory receptor 52D1-like n=1 Tax=Cynoglossus semilaevis TaxID=244447 RepID=UPI000D62B5B2|nr:olfactory receptor 52D1-like [Cynoglossus semilaevis]